MGSWKLPIWTCTSSKFDLINYSSLKETNMMYENSVVRQGHSSLPLQALIYLNWHFTAFFFLLNICLYTFKGDRDAIILIHSWNYHAKTDPDGYPWLRCKHLSSKYIIFIHSCLLLLPCEISGPRPGFDIPVFDRGLYSTPSWWEIKDIISYKLHISCFVYCYLFYDAVDERASIFILLCPWMEKIPQFLYFFDPQYHEPFFS